MSRASFNDSRIAMFLRHTGLVLASAWLALAFGCVSPSSSAAQPPRDTGIPITVYTPQGTGPFPAVVLMHHCGGIRGVTVQWRKWLVDWGYVVAVPDSFTGRGYPRGVCGDGTKVSGTTRAEDAYQALHKLETLPQVMPDQIAIIGHSHGGVAVLATVSDAIEATARSHAKANGKFRAAVAFYPWCGDHTAFTYGNGATYRTSTPLLILAGQQDDWTPAVPCQEMAASAAADGQPVSIKVYPGAYHAFDSLAPITHIPEARRGKGATIGGNPAAREDSIREVRAFLRKYLVAPPVPSGPVR